MIDDTLLEMAKETAINARDKWFEKNGPDIEKQVNKLLTEGRNSIIMQILGFHSGFGGEARWEIDHCNGRNGDSFIATEIAAPAKAACQKVLTKILTEWEPTEDLIQAAKEAYDSEVRADLLWKVRQEAGKTAQRLANEIAREACNGTV